ncbi:MAG TPA: GNAT family N-acetyltransferase [Candidatus Baltobacteraceae bacterium]
MSEHAIVLRPWSEDDLGILVQTLGDPAMMAHLGGIETAEQIAARHRRFLALPATEGMFTIRLGDACVGTIGYWETASPGGPVYETGWFVLPEYGGRGIASRAASQIVALARERKRLASLHAYPAVDNVPSNRVCEKAGFTNRGVQSFEYPKGHWMLCNDWAIDFVE